jgi:nucleoside phosphorylase
VVKGVSDYADSDKDDTYHQYAASVSAAYMLSFLKEYVTRERFSVAP